MSLTQEQFQLIGKIVFDQAGILLPEGKEYLVDNRVDTLVRSGAIPSVDELVSKLAAKDRTATELIVDAMTTNETSFFRDATPFEALRKEILPDIIERRKSERAINIWCAASSSGQEPVTLSMLIQENFPEVASWDVKIHATDISETMLERCRSGLYSQIEISRGLPAPLLAKYFEKEGLKWRTVASVRNMIDYRWLNLTNRFPAMATMDLVLIRNVLIYFDDETKQSIQKKVRDTLRPDGYLMLGTAETMRIERFERVKFEASSYYKLAA